MLSASHPLSAIAAALWLPENLSRHGVAIDRLFSVILYLVLAVGTGVLGTMAYILVRYRHQAHVEKARYIHGNTRIEIIWTVVPGLILLALAIWSKWLWDSYRQSPELNDPNAARVLVIARRFNWNVIYSGADRKLGQYLVYPKPTDAAWPHDSLGRPMNFHSTVGPSSVPRDQALKLISLYMQEGSTSPTGPNEFGKVFDPVMDPNGADDVINNPSGRLDLPVDRPTVIEVTSLDVIHDFYLPNFRVNVYAVPGMRIQVALTPTMTSKQRERQTSALYDLDSLPKLLEDKKFAELLVDIDDAAPGVTHDEASAKGGIVSKDKDRLGWRYASINNGQLTTIIRDGQGFPTDPKLRQDRIDQLKSIGLTKLRGHLPGYWEIVCAQLCGNQHSSMVGRIYVLDQKEWSAKYEKPRAGRGRS